MKCRLLPLAPMLFCLFSVPMPGRAQSLSATPNPVPLDGALTIQGRGFPPGSPILFWWDIEKIQPQLGGDVYLPSLVIADNSGSFSFKFTSLPGQVYPASAGPHTLTAGYSGVFANGSVETTVQISPRQNWPAPPALPRQASNTVSSGLLTYLQFSPDGNSTSLILNDGQGQQTLASFNAARGLFGRPEFSPDGTRLVFPAYLDTIPNTNLYLLDSRGTFSQLTHDGGSPPTLTGGGAGSLTGSIRPFLAQPLTDQANQDTCGELNTHPNFPGGMHVNLVGTNFNATALPTGGQLADVPYSYRFDNVPEGDYWLHAWSLIQVCQRIVQTNPNSSQQGQPATLVIHQPGAAQPSFSVPVHVAAGQVTPVPEFPLLDGYVGEAGPSWLDNQTLVYTRLGGVFQRGGGGLSEIDSLPLGGQPVILSDFNIGGEIDGAVASPANKKIASFNVNSFGMVITDPATKSGFYLEGSEILLIYAGTLIIDDNPSWSLDGGYIAFTRRSLPMLPPVVSTNDVLLSSITGPVGNLWAKSVSTGEEGSLAKYNTQGGEGVVGRPAWSPDLKQIAVTYTKDNLKTTDIRIFNVADGSHFDLTTDGHSALPAWTGQAARANFPNNFGFLPGQPAPPAGVHGDMNGDGKVTVADAILALGFAVGLKNATPAQLQAGDFNGDGKLTVPDVVQMLRLAVGL